MTLSAVILVLLVRRAWGAQATSGSGRTLGAAVVAMAVALAVGDASARALAPDSLWAAVGSGVVVAILTAGVYLAVMMVGDRTAMQAVRERGRARRRGRRA